MKPQPSPLLQLFKIYTIMNQEKKMDKSQYFTKYICER